MTADLRTRTTDTIAVITCQDVDGFEFLAKTSYQMTFLAGLYAPPLLEAIPKPYGLGNTGKPESIVLGTMLVLSTTGGIRFNDLNCRQVESVSK